MGNRAHDERHIINVFEQKNLNALQVFEMSSWPPYLGRVATVRLTTKLKTAERTSAGKVVP